MTDRLGELERALDHLIQAFATDGYRLKVVGLDNGALDLAIDAEPHACPECLVPPAMMAGLVRTQLNDQQGITDIRIKYPASHE
jgi:hypothetical protein